MKFFALILFFVTSSVCFADFQSISEEGLTNADRYAASIKKYLIEAKKHTVTVRAAKAKIEEYPSTYNSSAIQTEWDEIIKELREGLFCRGCRKTKREYGAGFEAHAADNGGTESASQSDIDAANEKYSKRWNIANEVERTYNNADAMRRSSIFSAKSLITSLTQAYQVSYDFQLKVYGSIKKTAKENFKNISDLLVKQNELVLISSQEDRDYKNYISDRFETAENADFAIDNLNNERLDIIKKAETKRQHFISTTKEIQEIASTLGNEIYLNPGAITTAAAFNYEVSLSEYLGVRSPEKLEKYFTSEIFALHKKIKSEGK